MRSVLERLADGVGSTIGGLLGTSALTTYVESAAAVREGGRTGLTAVICSILFFLSVPPQMPFLQGFSGFFCPTDFEPSVRHGG